MFMILYFTDAVLKILPDSNFKEIEDRIQKFLKDAPDRLKPDAKKTTKKSAKVLFVESD
jgi:hypothetical protein